MVQGKVIMEGNVDHTELCERIMAAKGKTINEKLVLPGFALFHTQDLEHMIEVYANLLKGRSHFERLSYVVEDEEGEKVDLFAWDVGMARNGTFAGLEKQSIRKIAEVLANETQRRAKRTKFNKGLYIELENKRL